MLKKLFKLSITLCFFITTSSAYSAGVYKWTDADGNTHYGDRPQGTAEKLNIKSAPTPDKQHRERMKKQDRLLSVLKDERETKKTDKQLLEQQKAKRKEQCNTAKNDLEKYKTAGYLYKLDQQGKRVVLEGKEYAQALLKSEESVTHWCS